MIIKKSHKTFFIIARNGKTSSHPFHHPTKRAAKAEAIRLSRVNPSEDFYVFASVFKATFVANNSTQIVSKSVAAE